MHSSTSMAIRLRNSMVVGFMRTSPREIVGNSSGKPPAERTPRLTASATCRRCALQLVSSDHELAMPMTGRPSNMASLKPSAFTHERWAKPSRSFLPNQLRLRSGTSTMPAASLSGVERHYIVRAYEAREPSGAVRDHDRRAADAPRPRAIARATHCAARYEGDGAGGLRARHAAAGSLPPRRFRHRLRLRVGRDPAPLRPR